MPMYCPPATAQFEKAVRSQGPCLNKVGLCCTSITPNSSSGTSSTSCCTSRCPGWALACLGGWMGGLSSRLPPRIGGLSSRLPPRIGGLSSRLPPRIGGLSSRLPPRIGGLSSRLPPRIGGLSSRLPPGMGGLSSHPLRSFRLPFIGGLCDLSPRRPAYPRGSSGLAGRPAAALCLAGDCSSLLRLAVSSAVLGDCCSPGVSSSSSSSSWSELRLPQGWNGLEPG